MSDGIKKLNEYLKAKNTAALITSEENVRYFTSFSSTNGYLVLTGGSSVFLTDSRYIEAAKNQISTCDEIIEIKTVSETLVPLLENLSLKKIEIEAGRMTVKTLNAYKKAFPFAEIISDGELDKAIDNLRAVKSEEEKEKIEKAQRIAEKAFDHILTFIKPGVTEREVSLELDFTMLRSGADALSFETIAVSGKNGSMPHGVPGNTKIQTGDFVTMDFGAVVDGYHSDMTRTVAVGQVSDSQKKVYDTVLAAQKAALASVKSGETCRTVDLKARDIITENGYGEFFGHGTGHGVGIEIHEFPTVSYRSDTVLKSGNVITVEPGIYLPGQFGVRIEDMVYVTQDGCYNFTKCEKKLIIL
ncbi:MAG: aminopeptidase P family protein [Acutalibacteraceae bacterium]